MLTQLRAKQDPCIYDTTGTLLTLLHWRRPGRASWLPLLDTNLLSRLASGKKTESYFPVAVANKKFHCIILKGGDQYPYFPRPLLSEFGFSVPLDSSPATELTKRGHGEGEEREGQEEEDGEETEERELAKLHQEFLLESLAAAQLADLAEVTSTTGGSSSNKIAAALARTELGIDKTLLQLLAVECRAGEERGMKALELVRLLRDGSGKIVQMAIKVAERYGRGILAEKIREFEELRTAGAFDGEEEEGDYDF